MTYDNLNATFSLEDPYSSSFFSYYLKNSVYEEEALKIILMKLSSGGIFADVGANIGYFSCLGALKNSEAKVFAFELGDENCKILERNRKLNNLSNLIIEHCAVSDFSGEVFHHDSAVGNAVLKIIESNPEHDPDIVPVRSVSLDDYFAKQGLVPSLIKIDVEGAEMKVLHGMKHLLVNPIHLLIEIHPKDLEYFHSSDTKVYEFLKDCGYGYEFVNNGDKKNPLIHAFRK
jgi:FkbM family methyltransferase